MNPAEAVDTRKVPEAVVTILAPEEVLPFFEVLRLEDRPLMATAILTGLRKGELCGLKRSDVDLGRRLLTVRRNYERPFPKSSQQRVVRIPDELVPFLEFALAASPSEWLLPDERGRMRSPTWKPEKVLQPALKRARIVDGYTHVCRRKGCTHREERDDAEAPAVPGARHESSGRRRGSGTSGSTTSAIIPPAGLSRVGTGSQARLVSASTGRGIIRGLLGRREARRRG